MNIDDLKKLQSISLGLSVIYLEKDSGDKKKISKLLEKCFGTVYYSSDENFALERYLLCKADIFIVSLPLKEKNIVEYLTLIKEQKSDAKIIVITYKDEDYEFLNDFDFGISGIITKPLAIDTVVHTLTKILTGIDFSFKNEQSWDLLTKYHQKRKKVLLYNSYKGIPVCTEASIKAIEQNSVTFEALKPQVKVLKYQNNSIAVFEEENRYIQIYVASSDTTNNQITFINPKEVKFHKHLFEEKKFQINSNKDLKVSLFYENKPVECKVIELSSTTVYLQAQEDQKLLKYQSKVDITFGFEIKKPIANTKETTFVKAFASGLVKAQEVFKDGYKITVPFQIKKADQSNFKKFFKAYELNKLYELKTMVYS